MSGSVRAAVGVVLVVVLAGGCSSATSGSGRAESFPPRPVDLRLDQVPACNILTDEQRRELGAGVGSSDTDAVTSDACTWKAEDSRFWTVRSQPQNPIAQFDPRDPIYLGNARGFQDPEITSVDGFGAVRFGYSLTGDQPGCNLALDVAPNASVVVGFANNVTRDPRYPAPMSFEQRCSEATRLASMVITTLRSRAAG